MTSAICLLTDERPALAALSSSLRACGLATWVAGSVEAFLNNCHAFTTLCVVADLPGLAGLEALEALRARGVREPVLLVADCALPADRAVAVKALDILLAPAGLRAILPWIECICAAHLALSRRHAKAA
ncbi:MAG: hypothetical protein ACREHE_17720 [Rhizomicrobium sp.]